jgi:hypothetical protein
MGSASVSNAGPSRRTVPAGGVELEGELALPPGCTAVVLFPHGSGNARPAGDALAARALGEAGLGTLVLDLLTAEEQALDARKACFRFDMDKLGGRLAAAAAWLAAEAGRPVCCFAGGNAAAAALTAAANHPTAFAALVTNEGRPDLADEALPRVAAPTLLLVDGSDEPLIGINRTGLARLGAAHKELVVLEGTAALVDDDGEAVEAAHHAARWFRAQLGGQGA